MSAHHHDHDHHDHDHHDHGHHDHDHGVHEEHEHDHDVSVASGPNDSLFPQIDLPNVVAMNAAGGADAGQHAIKCAQLPSSFRLDFTLTPSRSWENRDDDTRVCLSW